jgi:hypothetical protein
LGENFMCRPHLDGIGDKFRNERDYRFSFLFPFGFGHSSRAREEEEALAVIKAATRPTRSVSGRPSGPECGCPTSRSLF